MNASMTVAVSSAPTTSQHSPRLVDTAEQWKNDRAALLEAARLD